MNTDDDAKAAATLQAAQNRGQRGGLETKRRMLAINPHYYRDIGRLRRTDGAAHLRAIQGYGARIKQLRRLYQEDIDEGRLTLDAVDKQLLLMYGVTMTVGLRKAGKTARRRELGLLP